MPERNSDEHATSSEFGVKRAVSPPIVNLATDSVLLPDDLLGGRALHFVRRKGIT
jgi:hypothetical protein